MKNILVPAALFIGFLLVSCSAEDEPKNLPYREGEQLETSKIIGEIQDVNNSFTASQGNIRSRGSRGGASITSADIKGAYRGYKIGAKIGSFIGSFFGGGGASAGKGIGGFIGGAAGGISSSYNEWKRLTGCGGIEAPSIPEVTSAYCSIKGDIESGRASEEGTAYVGCLNLPYYAVSIEELGVIHNGALDILRNQGGDVIMPFGIELDTPVAPAEEAYQLSALEMAVLDSDEFVNYYNESAASIYEDDYNFVITSDSTVADQIMKLYLDGMESIGDSGFQSVVDFTNEYIAIVANSGELLDIEKENLYAAFSVAVYSYLYWSENY